MISLNLRCGAGHHFDGWFADAASFADQSATGRVICHVCGNATIARLPSAPQIIGAIKRETADQNGTAQSPSATSLAAASISINPETIATMRQELRALKQAIKENCVDVGKNFAEEARKIHYGEVAPRGIYGEASREQSADLRDEGIMVAVLPWLPDEH